MAIKDYISEIRRIIKSVPEIIGTTIPPESFKINLSEKPHQPENLPKGKMAVYIFIYNDSFLKIGKVGPNSNARFQSQHYNPNSAQSNLAKSLMKDKEMKDIIGNTPIDQWIKNNCDRIDVIIDKNSVPEFSLELIEAILHYRFKPKYEGNRF